MTRKEKMMSLIELVKGYRKKGCEMRLLVRLGTIVALAAGCGDNSIPFDDTDVDFSREISILAYPEAVAAGEGIHYVAFVAYQDGEGPWQVMSGNRGTYKATIKNKKYGIALGCIQPPGPLSYASSSIYIYHSTTDETAPLDVADCFSRDKTRTVTGTVAGALPAHFRIFTRNGDADTITDGRFSISEYNEPTPLVAAEYVSSGGVLRIAKMLRMADFLPKDDVPVTVDFSRLQPLESHGLIIRGGVGPYRIMSNLVISGQILNGIGLRIASQSSYQATPGSILLPNDLIRVAVTDEGGDAERSSNVYLAAPTDVEVRFGSPFRVSDPSIGDGLPMPRIAFVAEGELLENADYRAVFYTIGDQHVSYLQVQMSRDWIGDSVDVSYSPPDLSRIPGWSSTMALKTRVAVQWMIYRAELSTRSIVAGRRFLGVSYGGTSGSYCGNRRIEAAYEQCDPPNQTTCSETCQEQTTIDDAPRRTTQRILPDEILCWSSSFQEPCQ